MREPVPVTPPAPTRSPEARNGVARDDTRVTLPAHLLRDLDEAFTVFVDSWERVLRAALTTGAKHGGNT